MDKIILICPACNKKAVRTRKDETSVCLACGYSDKKEVFLLTEK